jgi:translation initiation factor 1
MAKKFNDFGSFAYSTNPELRNNNSSSEKKQSLPSQQQNLRVMRDSKNRGGKMVTLITGFVGSEENLKELGKFLKAKCGTGGTVKDGQIIIQGDFRDKIFLILTEANYKIKKAGG